MAAKKVCSIEGCNKVVHGRGLCGNHYNQFWRRQNPNKAKEADRRHYQANHEYQLAYAKTYREEHPDTKREWKRRNPEKVKAQRLKHYITYKDQELEKAREWKERNRQSLHEYRLRIYWADPEKAREQARQYQKEHPEQGAKARQASYQKYREQRNEYSRNYARQNPEIMIAKVRRRRARMQSTNYDLIPEQTQQVLSFGCFFASLGDCEGPLCIAHDIPLSEGGDTTLGNVFCLCRRHNSMMRTKTLSEIVGQLALPLGAIK